MTKIRDEVCTKFKFDILHELNKAAEKRFIKDGVTRLDISERLGIKEATVMSWLNGQNLTFEAIADLCWALDFYPEISFSFNK